MKKMAIFVEGATELQFIDRLLQEIADEKDLQIELVQASGGARSARMYSVIAGSGSGSGSAKKFFIRIINSSTDNRVASDIRDNYAGLEKAGFSVIIGIRDVYPLTFQELPKLRIGLCYKLRTKPISVDFVLGVMEIEAWFLAEHTHFSRIHPNLSASRIAALHGFDPSADDMQLRPQPALDLHTAYSLEGLAYRKEASQIKRTINSLDYAAIYLEHRAKFPDFEVFMQVIDQFFS
jgi:hypothetical protein